MGRKLAAKISAETDQMIDDIQTTNSQILAQTKHSEPLFVIDSVGSSENKRESLRRKRDEAEAAAAAQLDEQIAQVARKRQKVDNRKKQAVLKHGVDPSHSNNQQPIADQIEVYDMWGSSVPVKELPATKLARKFRAHINSSIIDAGTAMQSTLPHPGQSFNPAPEQHAELLAAALNKDQALRDEAEQIRRQLNPEPVKQEGDETAIKEEDYDSDNEMFTGLVRMKHVATRLTTAQRNRRDRHKALLKAQAEAKIQKTLAKNVERLPSIVATFKNREKRNARLRKAREERKALINPMAVTAPRLGPTRPKDLKRVIPDVALTEELKKSKHHNMLELTKAHPQAITAAWERLQQRRLIEPTRKQKVRRKYRLKEIDRLRDSKFEGQLDQYQRKL